MEDLARTAGNQATEELQASHFTWTIENFSHLDVKKLYSHVVVVGDHKWRVLIFPKGNNVDYFSAYLDVADCATLPYGWNKYAQFSLSVVNQSCSNQTIRKETQHQFNERESDWGFTSFMRLSELYGPNKGYLVNDKCVIQADVSVRKAIDCSTYDSKKETGYVGLKNQGKTGYINSLLQTLYHIPYFRKAVYHMPTTENDIPSGSIPLALQSLFHELQYGDTSVATKELTKSFGWETHDSFIEHDVQELNRVLGEKIEDKMKGTVVEGTIQQLFEGHNINYVECINVDFKRTRRESFYDLQLDVKCCKDVYASFDKYVEVERLEGENKYQAEEHGLQDARKRVLFIDFPPVLFLQLKRFEYDIVRDSMDKINDRYEFPLTLDLDRENGKYLSPNADRSVRNLYTLHSVLVHSGGVDGGHYYAFIRPTCLDQWYKFDDERVTKEEVGRALEEQYGGEELPQIIPGYNNGPSKFTKYSNAYMLVYIRASDKDKIICDVDENDIAEHLRTRLKKKQKEKEDKRRYKAEANLYTVMKVARDDDLREQIGKDIYFDLVDHDKVRNFRTLKQMPFNLFKEEVAKEFGIPVQFQRFWLWAKRQNQTYRPHRPLTPQEEAQAVGALREVSKKSNNSELKLFLEVNHGLDLFLLPPPKIHKEDILLFFKLYDPDKEELRYVGRLFVNSSSKPIEIRAEVNEMAGFATDQEIELFEEIKFEPHIMCERLEERASFRFSQIKDGDIICFQKRPLPESKGQARFPDVPSFLEYLKNRQIVHFRALDRHKEDEFCLELAKNHTYDDVVERVAQKVGLNDPSKIRLTPHSCYSRQPKPNPIKYRSVDHLLDMLVHYNQISDILYYEVLEIPLPELQCLKTLKVDFHHATKDEAIILNIRLPKESTVGDVLNEIKTKVELSHPSAELRLFQVFCHKIYKIYPTHENIENINDMYWTLRSEEIPEQEKNIRPSDQLIHVYHFTRGSAQNQGPEQQIKNFGEPFFLLIHKGETLAEVKVRIQKKLRVPYEDYSKWKFAFLLVGRPEYLEDSDIVSSRFQRRDGFGGWEQYLGLEHSDATQREYSASQITYIYAEELRRRKETEGTLERARKEIEKIHQELGGVVEELRVAREQKFSLECQVADSDKMVKEFKQIMSSAVELLQKCKKERDELQVERDNALRVAGELRERQAEEASSSSISQFFTEFSFWEIEEATSNFSQSLKIGEGGYGSVYTGSLRHTQVAIKKLNPDGMQGPSEYQQEVNILSKLRHPNIVTLVGACPEAWALIYEYLPNGSLEDRLKCKHNSTPLSWKTRTRIAAELCSALTFLHSCRPQGIIHGDLNPANILLDANLMSKLSDFGICRQLHKDVFSENNTTQCCRTDPKGTFAYLDPEFFATGELTPKSDVYSFGIILLMLLTGKPALGIAKRVQYALDKGNLKDLLDPTAGDWPFVQAKQLAHLALRCSDMNRRDRPDFASEVWRVLEPMRVSCGVTSLGFSSEERSHIPAYFVCPIFQEIMQDPVFAADGHTYESEAIKGWLESGHDTSPMTNLKLPHLDLVPNHAVRSAIQEWLQKQP